MKKSFTLLEILVAVTIFTIAASLTIATAANTVNTRFKTKNMANIQKNAQNITQNLSNLVFQSNGCGQITYTGSEFDPGNYYFYGLTVDLNDPNFNYYPKDTLHPHPVGTLEGGKIVGIYLDQFNNRIQKSYYLENGDLMVKEVINPGVGSKAFTRKLNDADVKVSSLTFQTAAIFAVTNVCEENDSYKPTSQSFLRVDFELESKIPDPKGKYKLHYWKYISAKNFNYQTRYQ